MSSTDFCHTNFEELLMEDERERFRSHVSQIWRFVSDSSIYFLLQNKGGWCPSTCFACHSCCDKASCLRRLQQVASVPLLACGCL